MSSRIASFSRALFPIFAALVLAFSLGSASHQAWAAGGANAIESEGGANGLVVATQADPEKFECSISGDALTWNAWPGATSYRINGGSVYGYTVETSYDLKKLFDGRESGNYTVAVEALSSAGITITSTNSFSYSYTSPYSMLPTPENLRWNGTRATWDSYATTLDDAGLTSPYNGVTLVISLYENDTTLLDTRYFGHENMGATSFDCSAYIVHPSSKYTFMAYALADVNKMPAGEKRVTSKTARSLGILGSKLIGGAEAAAGSVSIGEGVVYVGDELHCELSGRVGEIAAEAPGDIIYSWMTQEGSSSKTIKQGKGAEYASFAVTGEAAGKSLFCQVSSTGKFYGGLTSSALDVRKRPNYNPPIPPIVECKDGELWLRDVHKNQEYIVRKELIKPWDDFALVWSDPRTFDDASTANITALVPDSGVYYVYTRFFETESTEAGTAMLYAPVYVGDSSDVEGIDLKIDKETGQDHEGYRVGDVLKVRAVSIPEDAATFTGVPRGNWTCGLTYAAGSPPFVNGDTNDWATFYVDPKCGSSDLLDSSTVQAYGTNDHPYVYVKLKKADNEVPIVAKYGSQLVWQEIDVADESGVRVPERVTLGSHTVSVAQGYGAYVPFDFAPSEAADYIPKIVVVKGSASSPETPPKVSFDAEKKKMLVDASNAGMGDFEFTFKDAEGRSFNSGKLSVSVIPYVPLEGAVMHHDNLDLPQGTTVSTSVDFLPEGAADTTVTWSSSDPSQVSVRQYEGSVGFAYISVSEDATPGAEVVITAKPSSLPAMICKVTVAEAIKTCTYWFDANGGSGEMPPLSVMKGATFKLPACTFTPPAGKVFDCWEYGYGNRSAAGTSITAENSLIVTALWKDPPVTVPNVAIKKLTKAKRGFTAKWKKASGVSGYQVQYSLKKNFKKATTKTVKKPSAKKLKVKKLKSKKRYYVRIRAYKVVNGAKYYGAWSKAKKVKTK